jgi:hypothetical protein
MGENWRPGQPGAQPSILQFRGAGQLPYQLPRSSAATDDEHRGVHVRRRQERAPQQHEADGHGEP